MPMGNAEHWHDQAPVDAFTTCNYVVVMARTSFGIQPSELRVGCTPRVFNHTSARHTRCLPEHTGNSGPDVAPASAISCGVEISRYSNSEALAAVSNKSFGCTMCGKCCTLAEDAEVWISMAEATAIAAHLHLSIADFSAAYLQPYEQVPGWRLLQSKVVDVALPYQLQQQQQQGKLQPGAAVTAGLTATAGQQQQGQLRNEVCVFLDASSNACTIYPVRPLQCSTYPWWPELMGPGVWQAEQRMMCEGIEHPDAGQLDRWHAAQQLQQATEHALALEAAKPPGWDAEQQLYSHDNEQGT